MAVLSEIEAIAASVENDGIVQQPSEIDMIAASVGKNDPKNDNQEFPNDEPKEPDSLIPNDIDQSESNPDEFNPVPNEISDRSGNSYLFCKLCSNMER